MGFTYSFTDNELYGTDDINAAISRLTTKGVTVYPTDRNLIDAMNTVTAEVAGPGIDFSQYSCLVTTENDNIRIGPGTAFFEDGVSMVIDSEGILLPFEYNSYIYLYRDVVQNNCYPCISEQLPENNFVLLAYTDEQGAVQDRREYATSKLAPNSAVKTFSFFADVTYSTKTSPEKVLASFNVGYTTFSHVIFRKSLYSIAGYLTLPENEYSDYAKFYDGSDIRFRKSGTTLELFVNPRGDLDDVPGLEIIVF